jgi:hypothetical protein
LLITVVALNAVMAVCNADGNPRNPELFNMDAATVNCSGVNTLGIIQPLHYLSRQHEHARRCLHHQLEQ